jgi:hypothetical protein
LDRLSICPISRITVSHSVLASGKGLAAQWARSIWAARQA